MSNIEQQVKKIVAEQLGVSEAEVKNESSFQDDLGADSLDTVELVMALEEAFGCEIPDEEAEKITTVQLAIDYINAHGTSTPVGDTRELEAIRTTFANGEIPLISSTKSLSGHALGAAGSNEAIYSILMMQNGFVCGSANIQKLDEKAEGMPILRENHDMKLDAIMSNSFGFGGTNATLIFSRV